MLAVSEADPYVTLELPTVPGTKFKTKTITNSCHPVWNETFSFLIQSQVKVKARTTHLRTGCTENTFPPGLSQRHRGGVSLFPAPCTVWERTCDPLCVREPDLWQVAGPL